MSVKSWGTIGELTKFRKSKFKQRTHLKKLDLKELKELEVGACSALAVEWLDMHRGNSKPAAASVRTSQLAQTDWAIANKRAGVFNKTGSAGTIVYRPRINAAVERLKKEVYKATETDNHLTLIGHLNARAGSYHLILMLLAKADGGDSTGHLCAAYQSISDLTFFDPNSGEYLVANASRKAFFEALVKQYSTYVTWAGAKEPRKIIKWEAYRLRDVQMQEQNVTYRGAPRD